MCGVCVLQAVYLKAAYKAVGCGVKSQTELSDEKFSDLLVRWDVVTMNQPSNIYIVTYISCNNESAK